MLVGYYKEPAIDFDKTLAELLRTYAELVRMTAEMLVGQRYQQAEQQWRRTR